MKSKFGKSVIVIVLGLLLFWQYDLTPEVEVEAKPDMPTKCVVISSYSHVIHTDHGLGSLGIRAFIDSNERLLVPVYFFVEEFNVRVEVIVPEEAPTIPIILISYEGFEIRLSINNDMALVNNEYVAMGTKPIFIDRIAMVPLRFIGETLGLQVHYKNYITLIGSWFMEPTIEEAASWRALLENHDRIIFPWEKLQKVIISQVPWKERDYVFYWQYLGNQTFALYKSLHSSRAATLIADDLVYDNSRYGSEDEIIVLSFYPYGSDCYAVLHSGGATMGTEYLYKFSPFTGTELLVEGRLASNLTFDDDYIYFTYNQAFATNSTYRLKLNATEKGEKQEPERIGHALFSYGYDIAVDQDNMSKGGRAMGVAFADGYLYTTAFSAANWQDDIANRGFYRINLASMEHEKLFDQSIYMPQVKGDKVYFLQEGGIFSRDLTGRSLERIVDMFTEFFIEDDYIVYHFEQEEGKCPWQYLLIE